MKTIRHSLPALLLALTLSSGQSSQPLPRATPESQGVSSTALLEFVDALDQQIDGMHSVMVLRHGGVIAEGWWTPYDADHNHVLYSLSKSFTSTAVGFAIAEGRLGLFDPVLKFFPEDAPEKPDNNLKAMRVRDLLTMSTGHQDEPPTAPDAVSAKSFLAQAVPHKPGTHFKYNTAATFMLSAIVQKVTGETVLDYLKPRLFEPLGIESPVWDSNYQGISLGGYGLRVRTEDIAKLGQLYLQKGVWNGKRLLPAEWVELATSKQMSNGSNPESDWDQGYGFQFWRCRNNGFRGDGAFGQYCVVLPEQDTVIAITSGVKNMQAVLNVIWEKLLPALRSQTLKENQSGLRGLSDKLAALNLKPAEGDAVSPLAGKVVNRTFVFPENEQRIEQLVISPPSAVGTLNLSLRIDGRDMNLTCGHGEWKEGRGGFGVGRLAGFVDEPLAGTYGWISDDTLEIKICARETPFVRTLRLQFEGGRVVLNSEMNVSFGPTQQPQLTGRAKN